MNRLACLLFSLVATAALAQPRADVAEILRPALYDASLGESLDLLAQHNHDPDDPTTAGFERDLLEERALTLFARGTSVDEAKAFVAWTQRADVAPFLAMERESGDPEFALVVDAHFEANEIEQDRVDATAAFLETIGYPTYATLFTLYDLAGLGLMMESFEEERAPTLERLTELVQELDEMRGEQIYAASFNRLLDTYYVAFAKADVAAIERYTEAVREAPGQWYAQALPTAMLSAYGAALLEEAQVEFAADAE